MKRSPLAGNSHQENPGSSGTSVQVDRGLLDGSNNYQLGIMTLFLFVQLTKWADSHT
jgi:hypothetical protein